MKKSAWRRPSTSKKPQSRRRPGRRRLVENVSLVNIDQLKTSVWKPQYGLNYSYLALALALALA